MKVIDAEIPVIILGQSAYEFSVQIIIQSLENFELDTCIYSIRISLVYPPEAIFIIIYKPSLCPIIYFTCILNGVLNMVPGHLTSCSVIIILHTLTIHNITHHTTDCICKQHHSFHRSSYDTTLDSACMF